MTIHSGNQFISGTATGTTIDGLGDQVIEVGGTATNSTIGGSGGQFVYGTANNTIVNGGGSQGWQHVYSGGVATGTTVNGGDVESSKTAARRLARSSTGASKTY